MSDCCTPPSNRGGIFTRIQDMLGKVLSPWSIVVIVPVLVYVFDHANTMPVVIFAIKAFLSTLPYILFAVLLLAWLKASGAEAMVSRAFKGREIRMIFLAAVFGGLAPFCSCEVIPFIAGLLALGAPLSAVMAFWLSSPLIDPPTLLITAAALGWPFAIAKAVFAVGLGIFGGFAVKGMMTAGFFAKPLRERKKASCCSVSANDTTLWAFWSEPQRREIFKAEFIENLMFLVKWLAFAYTVEALLVTYVPASLIASFVGGEGIKPIATAALLGMPAYLNGYVAPALLSGLVGQGMSLGAAMAFMVSGAVSSIPAMAAVWSLVKRGVFATYLALGLLGAILSGVLFQAYMTI